MSDEVTKHRRGCLFYGCLAGGIVLLVVLIAALLGLSYAKRMITNFTDTQPAMLPAVQASPAQIDQVRQRYSAFQQAISQRRPTEPLALTGEDINVLIAHDPHFAGLKNKLYVTIDGDQAKGQVSVPLSELGWQMFRGRYLNGTATFGVRFQNGVLRVNADDVVVKGKRLPALYLNKIRQQNLAQGVEEEPRASIALEQLKDIQVKEGKLIIVPKLER